MFFLGGGKWGSQFFQTSYRTVKRFCLEVFSTFFQVYTLKPIFGDVLGISSKKTSHREKHQTKKIQECSNTKKLNKPENKPCQNKTPKCIEIINKKTTTNGNRPQKETNNQPPKRTGIVQKTSSSKQSENTKQPLN